MEAEEKNREKPPPSFNRADHLANERTFLAWMRTNLGIMAFGFVVEKFSLFIQQFQLYLGKSGTLQAHLPFQEYSSVFGISLVAIGALLCLVTLNSKILGSRSTICFISPRFG